MDGIDEKLIAEMVKKILTEKLGQKDAIQRNVDPSGIMSIKTSTVKPEKFDTGKEGDKVFLKDVLTVEESPRLGCGVMEMEESTFEWTLKYDEIDYIIDGTLEILIDGRKVVGNKGDLIFIPRDSTIQFSSPDYSRFVYVVYPANWAEQ
ncbi:cupin domain-containing protein [Clostridium sediminicola]|uniref:cupin domain-containing protein n=1 Tax=Clostridium sediminicola TaxID=3114879 RepID=UPI0031F1C9D6